jgi:hypothetical protein
LYDLLKPRDANVLVCDPRKNALLKDGSKSDRIDARKLAELLRGNHLSPIYHGENGVRTLKELARSYLTITKDLTRVMSRIKAVYRSWAIPCVGIATSFICYDDLDPDAYLSGAISFHATGYAALWKHCREKNLQVLADVTRTRAITSARVQSISENP